MFTEYRLPFYRGKGYWHLGYRGHKEATEPQEKKAFTGARITGVLLHRKPCSGRSGTGNHCPGKMGTEIHGRHKKEPFYRGPGYWDLGYRG